MDQISTLFRPLLTIPLWTSELHGINFETAGEAQRGGLLLICWENIAAKYFRIFWAHFARLLNRLKLTLILEEEIWDIGSAVSNPSIVRRNRRQPCFRNIPNILRTVQILAFDQSLIFNNIIDWCSPITAIVKIHRKRRSRTIATYLRLYLIIWYWCQTIIS